MKDETKKKLMNIQALKGVTVEGLVKKPEFRDVMAKYMAAQKSEYEIAAKAVKYGMRLPSHVIKKFIKEGLMDDPERFRVEYMEVISGTSKRSAAEREYIAQLGQQAYNLTVINFAVEEYPELRSEFFPEKEGN